MQPQSICVLHCQTVSGRLLTSLLVDELSDFGLVMSQRYPISIRVTGVMEKDKKKMYIASVLWSDEEDIVIYRTLEDFKKMHKLLKKAFPGVKKSERIVPKFHVAKKAKAGQKNGSTKSLNYLKPLQKYCNQLLSCDPQVNQSVHLIQFLHPKNEELQPEYSRNGIIITPPETQAQQEQILSQGGNVTQPFSTETYRCVAPYETKDTKNKPFKVSLDEKVDVLIKDKAGWWLVENEDKCLAWFPAPYLERTDDEPEEDNIDGLPERGLFYTVTKSYKATNNDEITVSIGASVEVLQKSENGWWLIRHQGKAGYIPSMYLKPPSHGRMAGGHHKRSSPILLSPSNLAVQSQLMSHSQENLQKPNPARPVSPNLLRPQSKQLSKSVEVLSPPASATASLPKQRPVPPPNPRRATSPNPGRAPSPNPGRAPSPNPGRAPSPNPGRAPSPNTGGIPSSNTRHASPPNASYVPTPIIMVENDADNDLPISLTGDSEGEFTSDSEFSSDEFSSPSTSTTTSLSMSYDDYRLRHSRTPPPPAKQNLNPESAMGGKMTPAISDPNIFKSVSAPKMPPRPEAKEILSRCTTITRKNANRSQSPTPIQSH
ncbi:NADPH oxidase organizer 1a [Phyllopteryx taeniolatus]|uniref:NADPH oxidase organizer 1a n=1 Tax=Phyllopteryx taeniolatus TaxID=161469 RepID=UPI002AD4F301|nr:NADPH oxidase organizer 1a [Phyllopteryx taeniolatus]